MPANAGFFYFLSYLKYHHYQIRTVKIEVKSGEKIKDGIDTIGKKTTLHTVKNKVSATYKKPSIINVFGDGFYQEIDVVKIMNGIHLTVKS